MAAVIVTKHNPDATVFNIGAAAQPIDLTGWEMCSSNAADAYVQVFLTKASSVTLGTTAPDFVILIPKTNGKASQSHPFPAHIHSEVGMSFAVTTTSTGLTAMTYGNAIDLAFFVN